MTNASRHIDGRPILWTDPAGTTHSCVRAEAVKGEYLIWTDCRKDVPPDAAHLSGPDELVTCFDCRTAQHG